MQFMTKIHPDDEVPGLYWYEVGHIGLNGDWVRGVVSGSHYNSPEAAQKDADATARQTGAAFRRAYQRRAVNVYNGQSQGGGDAA